MNIDVKTPDGKTITITGPDGASQEQIQAAARRAADQYKATMKPKVMTPLERSIEQEGPGLQNVSMTPITGPDVDQAGVSAAEAIGERGYPRVGAAVGTAIQMAPELAATALTGGMAGPARAAAQAGKLGMAGRIVSGPARAEAGAAIGAAEKAAGLDGGVVPSLNRMAAKLDMPKGSKTTKDYITELSKKVEEGKIAKQDLLEHHKLLSDLLKDEPKGFAKMISNRPSKLGASGVAQAAKTDAEIVRQLNAAAPGRADAAANYAAAMKRNKGYKAAAVGAGAALTGSKLTDVMQKVFGGR